MHQLRDIDQWFIDQVLPHEQVLLGFARRLSGDGTDASDLVQEAYSRLFEMDDWASVANPRAYVMSIIRNLVVQQARRAQVVSFQQLAELNNAEPADQQPDAFRIAASRDQMAELYAAVEALPQRNREVVVMRRFQEKSPREIATQLGLSISTMEKRLARGLALLARSLDRGPPDASLGPDTDDARARSTLNLSAGMRARSRSEI